MLIVRLLDLEYEVPEIIMMKYGSKEHMENLVTKGELYMKPLAYFRKLEGDELRGDPHEGIGRIRQMQGGTVSLKDPATGNMKLIGNINKATLRETNSMVDYINLFCMFAADITEQVNYEFGKNIDERVWNDFGPALVIIRDPDAFIERVRKAAVLKKLKMKIGVVQYEDFNKYDGEVGPFIKDIKYSYQKEIRIVSLGEVALKPIKLYIGNMSDIAILLKASDTPLLSFSENENA